MDPLTRHSFSAFGPGEPKGFARLRDRYHARRQQTDRLETKISRTDSGLDFVMRVRNLGKRRAR